MIIEPYRKEVAGRKLRPAILILLVLYSALVGAALVVLPPELLYLPAVPIAGGLLIILWLLPDDGRVSEGAIATLLSAWIGANCLWPNYISLDLPGLPWINPSRLIAVLILCLALIALSSSMRVRTEVADTMWALPPVSIAFWVFWATTLVTIPLSAEIGFSLVKWFNNQIFWTLMLVVSAWLCVRPGVMTRISRVLVWSAIVVGLEAVYEYSIQMVPWANAIPNWLTVDRQLLGRVLTGGTRAGTEIYRARGTFNHPLILAEYLAIVYPFMLHAAIGAKAITAKLMLAGGLMVTASAMYLSGARSGMIGFFMSIFLYWGFAAFRHRRHHRQSLIGVSAVALLPVMAAFFVALTLSWPRLHNITLGGGEHSPSTEARFDQWDMAVPKILQNPIGHGAGTGADVLGYANRGGVVTIDTYYVSLLLEYGFIGFTSFLIIFCVQAFVGFRMFVAAPDGEDTLVGPAVIALLNFLVIKSVSSSEHNVPLVFILLGFVFAVSVRHRNAPAGVIPFLADQSAIGTLNHPLRPIRGLASHLKHARSFSDRLYVGPPR